MIDNLRSIQKDYEGYLEGLQQEKKATKKFLAKVDSLAQKNAELGIEVDADSLKLNKMEELENIEKEIAKVKKVIHRLGKCLMIMTDDLIEESTEVEE